MEEINSTFKHYLCSPRRGHTPLVFNQMHSESRGWGNTTYRNKNRLPNKEIAHITIVVFLILSPDGDSYPILTHSFMTLLSCLICQITPSMCFFINPYLLLVVLSCSVSLIVTATLSISDCGSEFI